MSHGIVARLIAFALINLFLVIAGYIIVKRGYLLLSWLLFVLCVGLIWVIFSGQHPLLKMLAIIVTTFTAMKLVAVSATQSKIAVKLTFKQWWFFAGAWAGMRPKPFETLGGPPRPGAAKMIRFGIGLVLFGAMLIWLARLLNYYELISNPSVEYVTTAVLLLVGFSLLLHFGILSITAGMWRLQGADTYYLFRKPATALSLTEFWGKRWNLGFSEMTSEALYRPLKLKLGNSGALLISFIFSGLLHELALSVPANGGYGLPTLYFLIHALIIMIERIVKKKYPIFFTNKLIAHAWVLTWLIAPAPLLFHAPFIENVLRPMAGL
ncbi:MAG: membrane bound O-acyl transferase family-domain-containing protein [Mucilaginibacter sp.]|nr:membrane bound O-acyl transferase family-domain-containing protein [Mucilaginibacter sp.]